jgi:hypothetical protein
MRLLITTDTIGGVWIFSKNWCEDFSITTALSPWSALDVPPSAIQRRTCDVLAEQFPERFLYVASDIPLEWMEANSSAFDKALQRA